MWSDVTIGNGPSLNSAFVVSRNGVRFEGISENEVSYWVVGILHIGGRIYKASPEGKDLQQLIQGTKVSNKNIELYVDRVLLRNVNPTMLIEKLNAALEQSFEDGKAAKVKELRQLLDIYR